MILHTLSTLVTADALCQLMVEHKLQCWAEITSPIVSLSANAFKLREVRFTGRRPLRRLQLPLMKKIFMFRVPYAFFQVDCQFHVLLATLRPNGSAMAVIKMWSFVNLRSSVSSYRTILTFSWSVAMESLKRWITYRWLMWFGTASVSKQQIVLRIKFPHPAVTSTNKVNANNSTTMSISLLQRVLKWA